MTNPEPKTRHLDHEGRPLLPDETDPVRKRIVEAMRRLFDGTPRLVTSGRISVVALAEESEVSRNHLNRKYDDLRDMFLTIIRELNEEEWAQPVPAERHAQLQNELEEKQRDLRASRERGDNWKEAASAFIRKNQVLQIELINAQRRIANLEKRVARLREENAALREEARQNQVVSLHSLPD